MGQDNVFGPETGSKRHQHTLPHHFRRLEKVHLPLLVCVPDVHRQASVDFGGTMGQVGRGV